MILPQIGLMGLASDGVWGDNANNGIKEKHMTHTEALKQALEALKAMYDEGTRLEWHIHPKWSTGMDNAGKAITALREALAEQPAHQVPLTDEPNQKLMSAASLALEVLKKHRQMKGEYPVGMLGVRAVEEIETAFREIYEADNSIK